MLVEGRSMESSSQDSVCLSDIFQFPILPIFPGVHIQVAWCARGAEFRCILLPVDTSDFPRLQAGRFR